jgi:hypothetical protein
LSRAVSGALMLGALFLTLLAAPISTHAQESITIVGELQNGTAGAEVTPELTVTLDVFNLGDNLETRDTETDAQGKFSFEGVPGGEGFGYIISIEYAGAVYTYESDYPLITDLVEMVIYESTSSGDDLKVRSHTLVVNAADPDTQLMNALELVGLENTGDRTFVPDISQPGIMDLLRFSLPSKVVDLDVQTSMRGGQILQVDLGFAITTPVPPGAYEIAYTFRSSYSGGRLTFDHALPFGADTFRVLLLHGIGKATGDGLEEMERLVLGERDYQRLEATDLEVGTKIELEFTGLPEPSLWQRWQNTVSSDGFLSLVIPLAFGMSMVALLAYVLLRKKGLSATYVGDASSPSSIIEAIAHLDNKFDQREIGKQEYLRRRNELKIQVLKQPLPSSPSETQDDTEEGIPHDKTNPEAECTKL